MSFSNNVYGGIPQSDVLGSGQYGVVYRCVHRNSGEMYACKELNKGRALFSSPSDGVSILDNLMNEVRVLKGLIHPSIITTEDVFEDQRSLYIIQPLCRGGDLFARIVNKHYQGYPEESGLFSSFQHVFFVWSLRRTFK
jgi:calcium-dependent protein kinase